MLTLTMRGGGEGGHKMLRALLLPSQWCRQEAADVVRVGIKRSASSRARRCFLS